MAHRTMFIWAARHEPSPLTLNDDVCSLKFASACLRKCSHAGGNGKQIFGDAWWLEPEDDARLAAELAGAHAQGLSQSAAYTAAKASPGAQGDASSHAGSVASSGSIQLRLSTFPVLIIADSLGTVSEPLHLCNPMICWGCIILGVSQSNACRSQEGLFSTEWDLSP